MVGPNDGAEEGETPNRNDEIANAPPALQAVSPEEESPKHGDGLVTGKLRYLGMLLSLVIIAGGVWTSLFSHRLFSVSILLICVGAGIMLAAFSSQAKGTIFKFNIVGAGATAIALYLLVFNFTIRVTEGYVKGRIEQTSSLKQVLGGARTTFFVARPRDAADFEFIIFEKQIDSTQFYFNFVFPDGSSTKEIYIGCIDAKLAQSLVGIEEELVLSLEVGDGGQYRLVNNKDAAQIGQINKKRCDQIQSVPSTNISFWSGLVGSALAQNSEIDTAQQAVVELDAEDGEKRDLARSQIGQLTTSDAFQAVASTWDISSSSYRADLGRLVGWSEAIARDRNTAVYIVQSLSPSQLDYLVQLTGQGDYTLRQFSTEILHRLLETTSWSGGPSEEKSDELIGALMSGLQEYEFQPVMKQGINFSSANRYYNTLVSIEFSGCNISETYRLAISKQLGSSIASMADSGDKIKTFHKIKEIRSALANCK